MNTSNNNERCKTTGCGDLAEHHANNTGACTVRGCQCNQYVGKCTNTWLSTNGETYECIRQSNHEDAHSDGENIWYTDGNPAQPSNLTETAKAYVAGRKAYDEAMSFDGVCKADTDAQIEQVFSGSAGGGKTLAADVEAKYAAARAGARKALGYSPLDNQITGKGQPLAIELVPDEDTRQVINCVPIKFVALASANMHLFAIDSQGQLWTRNAYIEGSEWKLDTMPVR